MHMFAKKIIQWETLNSVLHCFDPPEIEPYVKFCFCLLKYAGFCLPLNLKPITSSSVIHSMEFIYPDY